MFLYQKEQKDKVDNQEYSAGGIVLKIRTPHPNTSKHPDSRVSMNSYFECSYVDPAVHLLLNLTSVSSHMIETLQQIP